MKYLFGFTFFHHVYFKKYFSRYIHCWGILISFESFLFYFNFHSIPFIIFTIILHCPLLLFRFLFILFLFSSPPPLRTQAANVSLPAQSMKGAKFPSVCPLHFHFWRERLAAVFSFPKNPVDCCYQGEKEPRDWGMEAQNLGGQSRKDGK